MEHKVTLLVNPIIIALASMQLEMEGVVEMVHAIKDIAPACLPTDVEAQLSHAAEVGESYALATDLLFPHAMYGEGDRALSDNELLVELAGRKCYNSFGLKAGAKENSAYIANLFGSPPKIPHASVMYHAKMTFFFAGISRRMSHELIRHYVGADRSEEGCPSQESTRYTEHPGHFVPHPRVLADADDLRSFTVCMTEVYRAYRAYIASESEMFEAKHKRAATGMDRKRIYEAAASYLPGAAATSMIWTTNPIALQKIFTERCDEASDLEFQRFAKQLRALCYERWPNLFRESNLVLSPPLKPVLSAQENW